MEEEPRLRKYIVYLEADVTVTAVSQREAERIAKEYVRIEKYSPLVEIDEVRRMKVVVSERKHDG